MINLFKESDGTYSRIQIDRENADAVSEHLGDATLRAAFLWDVMQRTERSSNRSLGYDIRQRADRQQRLLFVLGRVIPLWFQEPSRDSLDLPNDLQGAPGSVEAGLSDLDITFAAQFLLLPSRADDPAAGGQPAIGAEIQTHQAVPPAIGT